MCRQIFDSYNQGVKISGNEIQDYRKWVLKEVLTVENILNY